MKPTSKYTAIYIQGVPKKMSPGKLRSIFIQAKAQFVICDYLMKLLHHIIFAANFQIKMLKRVIFAAIRRSKTKILTCPSLA